VTEEIRAEIGAQGAIPFERFMELALYGDAGFYTRADGGSAGRQKSDRCLVPYSRAT